MIVNKEKIHAFCAEHSLGRHLKYYGIKIKFIKNFISIQR
jgi:hypothetical protein